MLRKNLILRIKNKKLNGNVSLLVILILLASSVIALLSINQIQRLMTYGNMTFDYFRSYYLAKAGTEFGLTEVYHREDGFNNTVESGNAIVIENLVGDYENLNPYFNMEIQGSFSTLVDDVRNGECEDNKIVLGTGEGIVLSLFQDTTKGTDKILNSEKVDIKGMSNDSVKNLEMIKLSGGKDFTFGLFVFDGANKEMNDVVVKNGSDLESFLNNNLINGNRRYLTIKNSGTESTEFCIRGKGEVPYSHSLITVQANYGDMEVGLQSVVKKTTPSWSLNVLGEQNGE